MWTTPALPQGPGPTGSSQDEREEESLCHSAHRVVAPSGPAEAARLRPSDPTVPQDRRGVREESLP